MVMEVRCVEARTQQSAAVQRLRTKRLPALGAAALAPKRLAYDNLAPVHVPFVLGPYGSVRIAHHNDRTGEAQRRTLGVLGLARNVQLEQPCAS